MHSNKVNCVIYYYHNYYYFIFARNEVKFMASERLSVLCARIPGMRLRAQINPVFISRLMLKPAEEGGNSLSEWKMKHLNVKATLPRPYLSNYFCCCSC